MADYLARRMAERGVRDIRIFDVSKTHLSFLLSEIWNYSGLLLGSCAYNGNAHPMMEQLCGELSHIGPKNKHVGVFGSCGWSGGGVKNIKAFVDASEFIRTVDPVEVLGTLTTDHYAACEAMASAMATAILS